MAWNGSTAVHRESSRLALREGIGAVRPALRFAVVCLSEG